MGFSSFVDFVYNSLTNIISFTSNVFGFLNYEVDLGPLGVYSIYSLLIGAGIVAYLEVSVTKWLLGVIK